MSNSFGAKDTLTVDGRDYTIFNLAKLDATKVGKLPFSLKILLENLLRYEDGQVVSAQDIDGLLNWEPTAKPSREIAYHPARVLLQDFTGVPAVVDLAAMRDAMAQMGGDPQKINPLQPADLVIDHSVQVDHFGSIDAFKRNGELEFQRNKERYLFLRWGQKAFKNFRVVPPETGIVHQVNLEYLAKVAFYNERNTVYPDTLVGTDSHTTMINGLGVLGWGVGGIEAEAAMLGQPVSMLIPQVVGFKLTGSLPAGTTATDLVLTVTQMLRERGVVGKFVEFYGNGIASLPLADRATIANMSPEYGATMGFFPVDEETLRYLRFTNRSEEQVKLVEAYTKTVGLFHDEQSPEPVFSDKLELDLSTVVPSIAGPKRPQDRIPLDEADQTIEKHVYSMLNVEPPAADQQQARWCDEGGNPGPAAQYEDRNRLDYAVHVGHEGIEYNLGHGAVVIAAITSCTNTSNPAVMLGAGLLAKNAVEHGLAVKPWVKTSLAPGSKVVTDYLQQSGLMPFLEGLGFHLVGYGCTTCIGNSGPLPQHIQEAIQQGDLVASSVLSGNRNFEGRINPHVRMNFLASPPLVVAYAIAGRTLIDFETEPVGRDKEGNPIFLREIWPSPHQVNEAIRSAVQPSQFADKYGEVFQGDERWRALPTPEGEFFDWDEKSTYVRRPSFLENIPRSPAPIHDISGARVLALLGHSVTTDHISPAGAIPPESPAAEYLRAHGVERKDFNSFGSRRGNHEVMVRGTFGNIRLRNKLVQGVEGGYTKHIPSGEQMSIYDAAMRYQSESTPLVVLAGKEYGTGSSRDWAAKGTLLLGVKAVIAESFERIHRSNLVGMGVLPLQFLDGDGAETLGLDGSEQFDIKGLDSGLEVGQQVEVTATKPDGTAKSFQVTSRLDTPREVEYFRHGGILVYALRQLLAEA